MLAIVGIRRVIARRGACTGLIVAAVAGFITRVPTYLIDTCRTDAW
jgi:hypothetical protein